MCLGNFSNLLVQENRIFSATNQYGTIYSQNNDRRKKKKTKLFKTLRAEARRIVKYRKFEEQVMKRINYKDLAKPNGVGQFNARGLVGGE